MDRGGPKISIAGDQAVEISRPKDHGKERARSFLAKSNDGFSLDEYWQILCQFKYQ